MNRSIKGLMPKRSVLGGRMSKLKRGQQRLPWFLGLLDGPSSELGTVQAIPGVPKVAAMDTNVVLAWPVPVARLALRTTHRHVFAVETAAAKKPGPSTAQTSKEVRMASIS